MADGQTSGSTRMSDESVVNATGKGWDAWFTLLDELGARELPHAKIVDKLYGEKYIKRPWWGQMVTVAYEQHIGRRVVGQSCDGKFTASASKTIPATLDEVLDAWLSLVEQRPDFNDIPLEDSARTSPSEKFRYWRASSADGSKIAVSISLKGEGKAIVAVDHGSLADKETSDAWKVLLAGLEAKPAS